MNWKLRFLNKTTLVALILAVVSFIYQVLGILNIVPPITEDDVVQLVMIIINLLVGIGVIVDPTTKGVKDSEQVLDYEEPRG